MRSQSKLRTSFLSNKKQIPHLFCHGVIIILHLVQLPNEVFLKLFLFRKLWPSNLLIKDLTQLISFDPILVLVSIIMRLSKSLLLSGFFHYLIKYFYVCLTPNNIWSLITLWLWRLRFLWNAVKIVLCLGHMEHLRRITCLVPALFQLLFERFFHLVLFFQGLKENL